MKVIRELYALPDADGFILYAPLKRLVLVVNDRLVSFLIRLRRGLEPSSKESRSIWFAQLWDLGLIGHEEPLPAPPTSTTDAYEPTNVTFLPTSDCNLRCIYCYADAGITRRYLSVEVAREALDLVFENARRRNVSRVQIGFLGGGEPFLAWNFVTEVVEYGQHLAQRNGIQSYFTGVTNGVMSRDRVRWITENFQYLNVSLDGTKEIQNEHRPTKRGRGSFGPVIRTLRMLTQTGFNFAVRATVSSRSVSQMPEISDFLSRELGVGRIQFEPLFACGRCRTQKDLAPDADLFIESFTKALSAVDPSRTELLCSALRIDVLGATFCGALADNFYITPDAHVTASTEVCSADDGLAGLFIIGKYDSAQGFVFFDERRRRLQSRTIYSLGHCGSCIAKWHCAGGCAVKAAHVGDINNPTAIVNCKIARSLTEHSVRALARGQRLSPRIEPKGVT